MTKTYFLLDSIMDTAVFILLIIFLNLTLKPKGGKQTLRLPLIATYVLQIALYFLLYFSGENASPPAVIDFFAWCLRMMLVSSLYEGRPIKNLAVYSLYSFSNTLARLTVLQALSFRKHTSIPSLELGSSYLNIYIVAVLCFTLLCAAFILLSKKLILPHLKKASLSWNITIACSAINVSYFILIPIISNTKYHISPDTASVLFISLLLAVAAVVIAAVIATRESSQRRQALDQNAMLQSQLEMQYQHFVEMEKADAELHKLRHDIANHMLILQDMLGRSDSSGAPAEYVQKLTEKYESATTSMICRNFVFNAVLCRQRDICQQKGIEFHFQIDVPAALDISDIDLMGVLSNMLSNAVNASSLVPEGRHRYVYISARLSADVLAIAIENSCCSPEDQVKPPAEDGRSHGWGLKIIKEAVEKYDGVFKLKIIEGKAFTSATLMNKKI